MTVKEAFELIVKLRSDKLGWQGLLKSDPYRADLVDIRNTVKLLNREIETLEGLVFRMELEDSYDEETLEFLNKFSSSS